MGASRGAFSSDKEDHAIPLMYKNENGEFVSNLSELEEIFSDPAVRDLKVAVVSVAGKYRRGKSFILNFFLRHLYARSNGTQMNNWLGSDEDELEGFAWKTQTERVTTGILIWSKIFIIEVKNEKIAVILMDTQGTFDDDHIMQEHTKIFALTTLLSSFEIYNVMRDIEEDDLQNLALFTTYTEQFHEKSDIKMGQKLHILVRDWSCPREFPFGFEGGKRNLAKKLDPTNRKAEFCRVREALRSIYEEISCFLMPYPGTQIIMDENSKGKISAMDTIFVKHLKEYVPYIFSEANIEPKKFNGTEIIVGDFPRLIKFHETLLDQNKGVKMMNIFEMYTHASFDLVRNKAFELYKNNMLSDSKIYGSSDSFECHHKTTKKEAMDLFLKTVMSGSDDIKKSHARILDQNIESAYTSIKEQMNSMKEFEWMGKLAGSFAGTFIAAGGCAASAIGIATLEIGLASAITIATAGVGAAIAAPCAIAAIGAHFGRKYFLDRRFETWKKKMVDSWKVMSWQELNTSSSE